MYPAMLNLRDRHVLVVGGGGVALRKIEGLLDEGAQVTVVAPAPHQVIEELAAQGLIALARRGYQQGEATRFALVFAATDDREVNQRVFEEANAAGIWVNVADVPELCSFHLPARVRRGAFQLAIASSGEAPFVVRRLRQLLERRFGEEWGEWIEAAGRLRRQALERVSAGAAREGLFDRFFDATVDPERLRARVPAEHELRSWFEQAGAATTPPGREGASASAAIDQPGATTPRRGLVSLVGGGPGDPGLLTVRGRQRLLAADAVVYDRLAITSLPCELAADVELHPVGKVAGFHPVPQEEINALLVGLGQQGKRVVRLKGGDPYVFGRGGEEAEALQAAGVPFEVVPGVTAGVAAPAYAGVPATHREDAVRLTLVTAHESKKAGGPQVRWDLLAQDAHATLVGYMGLTGLPGVVAELLDGGMSPQTPAAMIERGTTSAQRVVTSPLRELPAAVADAELRSPALFVIGSGVRHATRLDWFGGRPLAGSRLGVIGPIGSLAEPLELAGVELVEIRLPLRPAARVVIGALPMTGWIFSSPEEVEAMEEERDGLGFHDGMTAWCLSAEAATRARDHGWRHIHTLDAASPPAELIAQMTAASGA